MTMREVHDGVEFTLRSILGDRTLAVAKSLTGGALAHRIVSVPGSSAYFLGGVVAYANEAKERLLHVQPSTLAMRGAVSEETALEMARGVRAAFGADVGLSTTGVAGPDGGSDKKPVGLVYIALATEMDAICTRNHFAGGRLEVMEQSVERALEMLRDHLANQE